MSDQVFIRLCEESGLEVIPEYRFHPVRRWRVDYFFPSKVGNYTPGKIEGVALEVEGGVWIKGRHTRGSGFVKDMEKYNELARMGILLLRCQPKDLYSMIELIKECG